jgi:hypothetical protein
VSGFAKKALLIFSFALALLCCVCPWIGMLAMHIWLLLLMWAISLMLCPAVCREYRRLAVLGVPVAVFPFLFFMYGCALLGGPCL